jgi:hypothetical protein
MTILQSAWATQQRTTPNAGCAGVVVSQLFEYALEAGVTPIANDIIEIGVLPAGNAISRMWLLPDDIDTGGSPAIVFDVGLMSGDVGDKVSARTCGNEYFSASTAGQAGTATEMTAKNGFLVAASDKDRSIGIKITTAAATLAAAGQKFRILADYRAV